MKEERFFYTPDIKSDNPSRLNEIVQLPDDEAQHAIRVLRLKEGDEVWCMDGQGTFYRCQIASPTRKACWVEIIEAMPQKRPWEGHLTLAVAPTKNIDRTEWLVEKAVEIGIDRIIPLLCKNSERTVVKTERLERIAISAMKQSRKAWHTEIMPMTPISEVFNTYQRDNIQGLIAHCHNDLCERQFMLHAMQPQPTDKIVMIGPEGDFTRDEVAEAMTLGFTPISLGESRLRTETAAIVATELLHLSNT